VTRDRYLLFTTAFVRALATGFIAVLLGVYLPRLGFAPAEIGVVVGSGLAGAAVATFAAAFGADRIGRRRFLLGVALLTVAGGAALALASDPLLAALAAFAGMVNGMGRDRGASAVLEQAMLPATVTDAERTRAFAWYNVLQDTGHALGALLAGATAALQRVGGGELAAMQLGVFGYAALLLLTVFCYAALSARVEAGAPPGRRVSQPTRRVLWRISSLFAVDALAGGFLTTTLLAYFFHERFGAGAGTVGWLFFLARVANAGSHLAAARLARRFGLVNTMVFTHIPSSLLLVTVAFAPNFPVAAALFLLREALVEMDVPTRQSYVVAVVKPEERVVAAGVTQLVRIGGWALAPFFAGLLMRGDSLAIPLFIGAGMKIAYDLLLYVAFRHVKPPEEKRSSAQ
jgi:MFS family permease